MKKFLFSALILVASAAAFAQGGVTSGRTVVPLGGLKAYTAEDGETTYTINETDLQKITTDGNTANVYLFPETGGNWATDENKAIGIQGFYIDLGAAKTIGVVNTTWEGAAAGGTVYVTNTQPAADGTLTGETAIATFANAQETAKNATVTADNSGRYIVFVPSEATNWTWGVKIRTFVAIEKYDAVLTTLTATATATTLNVGGTATITAETLDQNNIALESATVSYDSDKSAVVAVSSDGEVTAKALGTATVTVTAKAGSVTLTKTVSFTVEEPFKAPATGATVPTVLGNDNVLLVYSTSDTNGKELTDTNPGWGGSPVSLYTATEKATLPDGKYALHVTGAGVNSRTKDATTTGEYTKVYVAIYPKTATTGQIFGDGEYAKAVSFALTPKQWNYVEVGNPTKTNYFSVLLKSGDNYETEFYLDHFYLTKPAADAVEVTVTGDVAKVIGNVTAANVGGINKAEAIFIDMTGVSSIADGLVITPAKANAIISVPGTVTDGVATATYTLTAKNQVVVRGDGYIFPVAQLDLTDGQQLWNGEGTTPKFISTGSAGYKITRQIAAGATVTTYLPAAATVPAGVDVYEFTDCDGTTVTFTKGAAIQAEYPYVLVNTGGSAVSLVCEGTGDLNLNKAIANNQEKGGVTFQGNLLPTTAGTGAAGLHGNDIHTLAPTATIGAFRAYFTGLSSAARVTFVSDATGISEASPLTDSSQVSGEVYTLSGQRVGQPTKGLYIVGGRKVIVKQ